MIRRSFFLISIFLVLTLTSTFSPSRPQHGPVTKRFTTTLLDRNSKENESFPVFLTKCVERADPVEVRMDATLASCFVFCRFLVYDIASGAKAVPGWELKDWIAILGAISSAALLSICWSGVGLLTGIFEEDNKGNVLTIVTTGVLAAPVWLILERLSGFTPPGEGFDVISTEFITAAIGLCCVMVGGRLFSSTNI